MYAPIKGFLTRNGKIAKVRAFKKFAMRNLGSLAVPFQGWSVIFLPVRSTVVFLQVDLKLGHAFFPRIGSTDSIPASVFFLVASAGSATGFAIRRLSVTWPTNEVSNSSKSRRFENT